MACEMRHAEADVKRVLCGEGTGERDKREHKSDHDKTQVRVPVSDVETGDRGYRERNNCSQGQGPCEEAREKVAM